MQRLQIYLLVMKNKELRDWLLPKLINGQVSVTSLRGTKQSHDVKSDAT